LSLGEHTALRTFIDGVIDSGTGWLVEPVVHDPVVLTVVGGDVVFRGASVQG
jgi:hypothetical protein